MLQSTRLRLFIAVDLPARVRNRLAELQVQLRRHPCPVRWVHWRSAHLTLKFLGDVELDSLLAIDDAVRPVAAKASPLQLTGYGVGVFPSTRRPRIIWAGISGQVRELCELQAAIERSMVTAGFLHEARPFQPHITLGRVHGYRRFESFTCDVRRHREDVFGDFTVERLALYRSQLSRRGPRYDIVSTFALGTKSPPARR